MLDRQIVCGADRPQDLLDDSLGILDAVGIEVILGVKVKVDSVITKSLHVRPTAGSLIALRVRGSHVGRVLSDDIGDCSLVLDHLLLTHIRRDVGQAIVRPGMRGDLVTLSDHTRNEAWVWRGLIDGAFVQVVASHEERRFEAIRL